MGVALIILGAMILIGLISGWMWLIEADESYWVCLGAVLAVLGVAGLFIGSIALIIAGVNSL